MSCKLCGRETIVHGDFPRKHRKGEHFRPKDKPQIRVCTSCGRADKLDDNGYLRVIWPGSIKKITAMKAVM
jgi:hypothetical protein